MGSALEAREIDAGEGHFTSEAEGDVEVEGGVLVIKRIRVRYQLKGCPPDKEDAARRAHEHHAAKCPVYRSIGGCIDISTTLEFVPR
ncbi:MAG: OsmC family protein [Chloroflexi bacterium]|nr:MAG: OsmC family protein [Chloroflexota bacterium]